MVTTLDGELLEQNIFEPMDRDNLVGEVRLAAAIMSVIEDRFETIED